MAKYCDTKVLESVWLAWQMASDTPLLEQVRQTGLLMTKPIGGGSLHCVASSNPHKFSSNSGNILPADMQLAIKASFFPHDPILSQKLFSSKYMFESSADESWTKFNNMVHDVCAGVALKFKPATDDIRDELIHEAFAQIVSKIRRGKLRVTPGRAPAFNLLTTAIFRVMYTIKNKEKRIREHKSELVDQIMFNSKLPDFNSIRVSRSLVGI